MKKTLALLFMTCAGFTHFAHGEIARTNCPASLSSRYYFPISTFENESSPSPPTHSAWYSRFLVAMKEPTMSCGKVSESYRFLWLRTFHHPISIRISVSSNKGTITAIEMDGAGGYDAGKELKRTSRALSSAELESIRSLISANDFWSLEPRYKTLGLDGSQWVIEGRKANIYHAIHRWSPENGEARLIGLRFLSMSKLNIATDEIY